MAVSCGERAPRGGPIEGARAIGQVGRAPGQFGYPRGIDAHGSTLVVVDKLARVQRIDARSGDFLGGFMVPDVQFGKPTGLTVGPNPADPERMALWIADTHSHRVSVYALPDDPAEVTSAGMAEAPEPVLRFGRYGADEGCFIYPTDIAVLTGADGSVARVYVSEYGGNDRVSLWEPDPAAAAPAPMMRFVRSFGVFGTGPGVEFNRPQSLALDPERGELFVADAVNHRIGRFTLEGELIAWIGSLRGSSWDTEGPVDSISGGSIAGDSGGGGGDFRYPYGLQRLPDGTLLVAEFGGSRVSWLDPRGRGGAGEWLGAYGEPGRGPGQLANPWGIAVIGREAFVLDSGNDRILAFASPVASRVVSTVVPTVVPMGRTGGVGP